MNKLFIIQLITSFLVGGAFISMLSFIAEKTNKRVTGIILGLPTTVALGFFFLGWTLSPKAVADIVPSTLIPLGLSMLFAAAYAYIAEYSTKITKNKTWQIIISFMISIGCWFALAVPVVIFEINNIVIGTAGYIFFIVVAHLLLRRKNYKKPLALTYTLSQKIGRATFVGFIIFLVVLLGKILSPFWGGLFAMFPATFSSLLMILHWYYGPKSLFPTMQKVAVGSFSLFAYAITTMLIFPVYGFVIGTVFAYAVSVIVVLLLIKLQLQFSQCIAAIFGGILFGIIGFIQLANYGGNYGCAPFIDNLFGTRGYESCGSFGGVIGIVIGSILSILLTTKINWRKFFKH